VKTKSGKQWKKMYTFVDAAMAKDACIDLLMASNNSAAIAGWVIVSILFIVPVTCALCLVLSDTDSEERKETAMTCLGICAHVGTFVLYICLGCAMSDQPSKFEFNGVADQYGMTSNENNWMVAMTFTLAVVAFVWPGLILLEKLDIIDEDKYWFIFFGYLFIQVTMLPIMAAFNNSVPAQGEFVRDDFGKVAVEPRATDMVNFGFVAAGCWTGLVSIIFCMFLHDKCGDMLECLSDCCSSIFGSCSSLFSRNATSSNTGAVRAENKTPAIRRASAQATVQHKPVPTVDAVQINQAPPPYSSHGNKQPILQSSPPDFDNNEHVHVDVDMLYPS
jgi:hypothetical protein